MKVTPRWCNTVNNSRPNGAGMTESTEKWTYYKWTRLWTFFIYIFEGDNLSLSPLSLSLSSLSFSLLCTFCRLVCETVFAVNKVCVPGVICIAVSGLLCDSPADNDDHLGAIRKGLGNGGQCLAIHTLSVLDEEIYVLFGNYLIVSMSVVCFNSLFWSNVVQIGN